MPAIISAQNISSIIIFMDKWVCFMLIPRKNQKALVLLFIYTTWGLMAISYQSQFKKN